MQLIYLQNRLGVFVLFFMLVRLIPSIEGLTFLNVFLAFLAQCYKVGKLKVTFTCDKTIKYVKKKAYHQMLYLLVLMCDVLLYL